MDVRVKRPALMGGIDPRTDTGTECFSLPPLSIVDEHFSSPEMVDRMCSDDSGGNVSKKVTGNSPSVEGLCQEVSEEERHALCEAVESCDFRQESASASANCSPFKELASQQSVHFFPGRDNHRLHQCSASDAATWPVVASDDTGCGLILAGSALDPCNPAYTGGNGELKSDCVATKRRNPKRAASLRSIFSFSKLDRQAGKKHVRVSKKVVGLSNLVWESLKTATKKRSFRNNTRVSGWGAVENLCKIFKQDDVGLLRNAQAVSRRRSLRKADSSRGRKIREPKLKKMAENSRKEIVNTAELLHLDGVNSSHFSDLMDLPHFTRRGLENCLPDEDQGDPVCHNFSGLENSTASRERDLQHLDKDPDSSVTEEMSGENNSNDLPVISSQTIPLSLQDSSEDGLPIYPGTSPESDVIHPTVDAGAIASEVVTSTDQAPSGVGFISQNAEAVESSMHDNLLSDLCTLPGGSTSVSSSMLQQSTSHREDTADIGDKSCKFPFSELASGLASLNKTGEVGICKTCEQKAEDESNSLKCYNRRTFKKHSKNILEQELQVGKSGEAVNLLHCGENSQGKVGEQSCLSSSAGGKIKDAEAGESNSEAPISTHNAKRQNPERRNNKEKALVNKHKGKHKPPLDKLNAGKGIYEFDASTEKDEELPWAGCNIRQNDRPLDRVAESSKMSMDGVNLRGLSGPNVGNVSESEVACFRDKAEIQNSVSQDYETLCPREEEAWVCCDDCSKWRSIPEKLADFIEETKCRWTCKDNHDERFADCSMPQEKSNAEINAELGIADEEAVCDVQQSSNLSANNRAPWISIRSNLYLHRSRKKQTIDEIMVCHCKPPLDGSLGCRDECLNRMLNIECVRGTCPCGDLCSNQQFQKRKYAKMKWFHSGKKGYGLKLLENVSEGDFLIEYVGEVLDMATYEARQRDYASRGQEHFYFMTLNSHEVIDACNKGNLGRFINHSCEPNCRTEKWMVKGEVCIGLFAIRDIKKGEEITFDYNYVRVVGAAAKKCFCGSANCRGFIGGDPLNGENITHCESHKEFARPAVVGKDVAVEHDLKQIVSDATDTTDVTDKNGNRELNLEKGIEEAILVNAQQHEDVFLHEDVSLCGKGTTGASLCVNPEPENHSPLGTTCRSLPDVQPLEVSSGITSVRNSLAESSSDNKTRTPSDTSEHGMATTKGRPPKLPHLGGNNKSSSGLRTFMFQKLKKINGGGGSCQFEGVEEKLNALLDSDGGISKKKDSAKGYLKLLVVTAASNNAENETIQSTRDLSLILDALLKTKSRTVLTDIINKNGLQMLHNLMKQNRGNSIKIPILRKLLKVLEFLASKGILSVEQINMDPPRVGVESFRDSIMSLTYHSDIQVHQIARSFRDRWIPRMYRRTNQQYRDRCWFDPHNENSGSLLPCKRQVDLSVKDTDDSDFVSQKIRISSASTGRHVSPDTCLANQKAFDPVKEGGFKSTNQTKIRKRKSRWDQDKPPDTRSESMALVALENAIATEHTKFSQFDKAIMPENGAVSRNSFLQAIDDEAPPGFDSPLGFVPPCKRGDLEVTVGVPSTSGSVVVGQVQERYLAQLTVSHGIPLALMQQLGTPGGANRNNQCSHCWDVAPGMPFHPFPPLPPYARDNPKACPPSSTGSCSNVDHRLIASGATDRSHLNGQFVSSSQCDPSVPCISGETPSLFSRAGLLNAHYIGRCRRPGAGRCSFRPEKCNNRGYRRFGPPWVRDRHHQVKANTKCGAHGVLENSIKKDSDACDPNGVRGEDVGSTFHLQ